jgi:hypothetical protein
MRSRKWIVFLVMIAACKARTTAQPARPAPQRAPAPMASSSPSAPPQIVVNSASGTPFVQVAQQGGDLSVTYADGTLIGRVKDSGKRKYAQNGSVVLEVKRSDDGFKVRTADGKLLWKIKIKDDKIKISDNEENKNPFELKIKDEKVKVYDPGERLLAEVKKDAGGVKVVDGAGTVLFKSATLRPEPYAGVAAIQSIPPRERAVIIAELATAGSSW